MSVNWGEFSKSLPTWSEKEAVALWGETEKAELDQPWRRGDFEWT